METTLESLEAVPTLRMALTTYERPSDQLVNYANWALPANRVTLEMGLSALSVHLARRSTTHTCILPSDAAAADLQSVLSAGGLTLENLRIVVGDSAGGATRTRPAARPSAF